MAFSFLYQLKDNTKSLLWLFSIYGKELFTVQNLIFHQFYPPSLLLYTNTFVSSKWGIGHFLTCFIALTMIKIIQHKILKHQGKKTDSTEEWENGLSAKRVQNALLNWQADELAGCYYRTTQPTKDLELILDAFGIKEKICLPTIKELHALKYAFDKTVLM